MYKSSLGIVMEIKLAAFKLRRFVSKYIFILFLVSLGNFCDRERELRQKERKSEDISLCSLICNIYRFGIN